MGDEHGSDDAMEMGEHDTTSDTVGGVAGVHGVSIESVDESAHALSPDGVAVADPEVPAEVHHSSADGAVQEKLHEAYEAVTHPDTTAYEPNPVTEQTDEQRHAEQATDDLVEGRHIVHLPEEHF